MSEQLKKVKVTQATSRSADKDALIDHLEAEVARLKKLVAERDKQIKDIYAALVGG